jgi:hypothetical protein
MRSFSAEVSIPSPQQFCPMLLHQGLYLRELMGGKSAVLSTPNGFFEPELRKRSTSFGFHMDVRRFSTVGAVKLVAPEEEAIGTFA